MTASRDTQIWPVTREWGMRAFRRISLAVGAAGILGLSMLTATPAWASTPTVTRRGRAADGRGRQD